MMYLRTMTVSELSRQANVSRTYIYGIISGKPAQLNMKCLKRLAKALGCTPAWLLRKED